MQIQFISVGRDNDSWTDEIESLYAGDEFFRSIRKNANVMSADLGMGSNFGKGGMNLKAPIYAGSHVIGHYKVLASAQD